MNKNFEIGEMVFFLQSNKYVLYSEIINIRNSFCVIRFPNAKSGTRVRLSKIYKTEEEALLSRYSTKYISP